MTTDPSDGDDPRDVVALAAAVGRALAARGWRITTAESCTGGLVAGAITEVAGSSDWFAESVVTYSNEAKRARLGVAAATLDAHGAVSEAVVREMAEGALERASADLAIAVSGIAGPGGAAPGKPVGTVWIAVSARSASGSAGGVGAVGDGATEAVRHRFDGDRASVRRQAVEAALRASLVRLTSESR